MECDHGGRGEGKRTILRYFIFLDKVFLKKVLGLLPYEGTTFMLNVTFPVKARQYVNLLPFENIISSILFVLFSVQNLCCNDSKYHSLSWKGVSVTNVNFFEKKLFSLQFFNSLLQVYIACRVSFIFHLVNAFLVSVSSKGFAYLLCWPRRNRTVTQRFSFHEFYTFLLFNFFFLENFFYPHPHPHPRPTTSTHYPRPMTFSYTP